MRYKIRWPNRDRGSPSSICWERTWELNVAEAIWSRLFGLRHTQRPKLHDGCSDSSKAIFHAKTNRGLEDCYSVWGHLCPDSSQSVHSQVHELLQPTAELLAIWWKWFLQENSNITNPQGDVCHMNWVTLGKNRESSFLEAFSKFLMTIRSCNSTE
jgi:hypothetical protein